ncbi:MAG: GtrA family protein [Acutalibacteraceae bacterium]
MIKLFKKHKSLISYAFFGMLTTLVNIAVYHLSYTVLDIANVPSTVIAWIFAVAFAFITNKLFVFESKSLQPKTVLKEAVDFTICRIGTGVIEVIMMYLFVDILGINGTLMKLITNIIVIVLNYIASKLFIFKSKTPE